MEILLTSMNDRIPNQHHINIKGYKVVHYSTKQSSVATVFLVLNMYCFSYHKLPSTVVHKPAFQYCVLVTVHDGNPILCKLIGINVDTYSFLVYFRKIASETIYSQQNMRNFLCSQTTIPKVIIFRCLSNLTVPYSNPELQLC